MTLIVQAESRGQAQSPVRRQIPGDDRRQVMRSVVQPKGVTVTESAVHLDSGNEILTAERTALGGGL